MLEEGKSRLGGPLSKGCRKNGVPDWRHRVRAVGAGQRQPRRRRSVPTTQVPTPSKRGRKRRGSGPRGALWSGMTGMAQGRSAD